MVFLISRSHRKKEGFPVVDVHPHHPYPTSLSSSPLDFLDASIFDGPFSPLAPSISESTVTLSQLPFIPTIQTPEPFVLNAYWLSPGSSYPLPPTPPGPTNTAQDFPVHGGLRRRKFPFKSLTHTFLVLYTITHRRWLCGHLPTSRGRCFVLSARRTVRIDSNPVSKEMK